MLNKATGTRESTLEDRLVTSSEGQCPRGPDAEICDICHCNQYLYRIRRQRGDKQTMSVVLCSCGGMPTNSCLLHSPLITTSLVRMKLGRLPQTRTRLLILADNASQEDPKEKGFGRRKWCTFPQKSQAITSLSHNLCLIRRLDSITRPIR